MHVILSLFFSAGIRVGYVQTNVTVFENDRVAMLTVAISVPSGADPIETSFYLLVNTMDGSVAGLSQNVVCTHTLLWHSVTNNSLAPIKLCHTHTHTHTHTHFDL